MMKSEARAYDENLRLREGKRIDIPGMPAHVLESLFLLDFARLLQHGRRHVDTRRVFCYAGKGADQQSRPASHVQHRVIGSGLSPLHNAVERLFIADGCGGRERGSLTRELVENA